MSFLFENVKGRSNLWQLLHSLQRQFLYQFVQINFFPKVHTHTHTINVVKKGLSNKMFVISLVDIYCMHKYLVSVLNVMIETFKFFVVVF